MKGLYILNFIFLVSILTVRTVDTKLGKIGNVLSTVTDVISFGLDLYSFFDSLFEESEESIDYDRIIDSISERIEISTEKIIDKIELQSYIAELRDIALIIKQLLSEVMNILQKSGHDQANEYRKRFVDDFKNNRVKIYKIKSLLTFTVSFGGSSNSLLSVIVKQYDCSIPKFWEFKTYYMTLVSDAVAMDLLYEKFSYSNLDYETMTSWHQTIDGLFRDFKEQEDACVKVSLAQAKTDFENTAKAEELYESNHRKYPHLISDILHLGGSYCALVLKGYDELFKKSNGNTRTFQFISSEENYINYNQEQLQRVASTVQFDNCKSILENIWIIFDASKLDLVLWVMYPTSPAAYTDILLDKNSSAHVITSRSHKIVTYLRDQDDTKETVLTQNDFDEYFYIGSGTDKLDGMKVWGPGLIITSSIAIIAILC
ncbi:uncharacterized protein LOC132735164 [Ruditapes philippinarum]|uniref:uncharacterized protein LOC132735164 n=1 Tax=Ruditapes philippinarum TaxID=129788 RepID=UPI00295B8A8F|nr:uncharacterized protein LOC132735164 [Ruditapes philippinarum]